MQNSKGQNISIEMAAQNLERLKTTKWENNDTFGYECHFWYERDIAEQLKSIKSKVLQYEDEICQINANKKLQIELYTTSVELLGL